MTDAFVILVVGMIIDYVFMKTLPILKKRAIIIHKNWGPKFQAFLIITTVVQYRLLAIGICKND